MSTIYDFKKIKFKNRGEIVDYLIKKSRKLRIDVLKMIYDARSGHPGSSFSAIEIITTLFYHILRFEPNNYDSPDRDIFILSKGHAVPVLYAVFSDLGIISKKELKNLRKINSRLQGHPCRTRTPGVETSGSLGHGLSIGCGIAYAASRLDSRDQKIFVLLGDGELHEGQIWEAAMFASHYKLNNLIAIVDRNGLQFVGSTEEIIALEPLADKWKAFGWNVLIADNGHDIKRLINTFELAISECLKPTIIIAKTVKGKGVSFMENNIAWHGTAPNKEQYISALEELERNYEE
jgi:transketolase